MIKNNVANSNEYGIYLYYSSNCVIKNNVANSNRHGIYLVYSSNCTLENNNANSNEYGIYLGSSSNCTLTNNIANSNRHGIYLGSSSNCVLENNVASSNSCGIRLWSTSINNNIRGNTVSYNTNYGMRLSYSGDNEIYHNNFLNNNEQAYDYNGFNSWDKGASVGGNYWSDHSCSGNPSNGTEPYTGIDTNAGAVDTYPFEEPDGWVTVSPPFATTDAVIALQIAAGSRPPDLRWDVSGDKRVTSLDALMILKAAGGGVKIG